MTTYDGPPRKWNGVLLPLGDVMEKPFVRDPYNYDRDAASDASGLKCEEKSLTQQHFKEEVDINTIVERFGLTGEVPVDFRAPTYGDFTGVSDFHTAMNSVVKAKEAFESLPANIRKRFGNDPQQLLEFIADDANRAEAEKLGLVQKVVQATATAAPGTTSSTTSAEPAPAPSAAPAGS